MAADPFALPTGGFDDFDAVITDPVFILHDSFADRDGNPMTVLSLTLDLQDGEHEPRTQLYACGAGWIPVDGGKSARPEDDPENDTAVFKGNNKVCKLRNAIIALCPDVIRERYAEGTGVGQTDAAMFDGLKFHWLDKHEPKNLQDANGKWYKSETETTSTLLPSEFLGVEGAAKKTAPAKAKKAPAKAAAAKPKGKPAPAAEETETDGPDAAFMATAKELYDAAADFDGWLESMLTVDGVEAHMALVAAPDGGLWDQLVEADG